MCYEAELISIVEAQKEQIVDSTSTTDDMEETLDTLAEASAANEGDKALIEKIKGKLEDGQANCRKAMNKINNG